MKNITKILLALVLSLGSLSAVHANKWEAREDDNTFDVSLDDSNVFQGADLNGNAATASALAANPSNCSAGQYPLGIDASGVVESCTADDDSPDSDAEVPDDLTIAAGTIGTSDITLKAGTAPTVEGRIEWNSTSDRIIVGDGATTQTFYPGAHTGAAHGDGANCSAGQAPLGVDAAGAVQSCFDVETDAEATSHEGSADAHYVHATTLAELNTDLGSGIVTGAHTSNTDAASKCSGATTYLNGEDGCIELGAVYQASSSDLTVWASVFQGRDTTANICASTPVAIGDVMISSNNGDFYTAYGVTINDWRNGRTGIICP